MTPHLFVAPDGYGDPTIYRRDSDDDRLPQPILARTAANARGFDALVALVEAQAAVLALCNAATTSANEFGSRTFTLDVDEFRAALGVTA